MTQKDKFRDAIRLLSEAQASRQASYEQAEHTKLGTYRGGNAAFIKDGTPNGQCPRIAYLRNVYPYPLEDLELTDIEDAGAESILISSKHIMFAGGLANEEVWQQRLEPVLDDQHVMLCEDEFKLGQVILPNGLRWSGRPDQGICVKDPSGILEKDGEKVRVKHVLEHKGVYSTWVARDVLLEGKPKMNNVVQCALYLYLVDMQQQLGMRNGVLDLTNAAPTGAVRREHPGIEGEGVLPPPSGTVTAELLYTNYDNFVFNEMVARLVPRWGQPGSEWIAYRYKKARFSKRAKRGYMLDTISEEEFIKHCYDGERMSGHDKEGKPFDIYRYQAEPGHIKPFVVSYDVRVCHDLSIEWKPKGVHEWVRTGVTMQHVWDFYMTAERMKEDDFLLPKTPQVTDATGKVKFEGCTYCPLKEACASFRGQMAGQWREHLVSSQRLPEGFWKQGDDE